jgi:hypothetical protein
MLIGLKFPTQMSGSTVEEPLCHTISISHIIVASRFSLLIHTLRKSRQYLYQLPIARPYCLFTTHHVSVAKSGTCDIIFPLLQSTGRSVNLTIMSSCLKVTLHLSTIRSVLKARPIHYPGISTLQPSRLTSATPTKHRHTRHLHRWPKTGAQ